jgi:soluble lytic murein transglycosylase-like protein
MMLRRAATRLTLVLLVAAPAAARGADLYGCRDADGVVHLGTVPTADCSRRVRGGAGATLYRPAPAAGEVRAIPSSRRREAFDPHVKGAAEKYRLPEALIVAVMAVESNFDPRAISDKGAMGLMQLMPATAKELFVADPWDPAQNIEGGARYLRLLANQYSGDLVKTLAAYNAGPDAVRRAGEGVPDIPETREYVRKVVALYQAFKAGR